MNLAVAVAAVALASPVKTLAPIPFAYVNDSATATGIGIGWLSSAKLPPVTARLSVLRQPRHRSDSVPKAERETLAAFDQAARQFGSHSPGIPELAKSRRLLEADGRALYLVPTGRGNVYFVTTGNFGIQPLAALTDKLVWFDIEQTKSGTLAYGVAADGVMSIDVVVTGRVHHTNLARNGFIVSMPGVRATGASALLVSTKSGEFRLPLDRRIFKP